MSIIADAMQPLIPKGILNAAGKLEKTAASDAIILGKLGYAVALNPDSSLVLDFRDDKHLIYALCCDCSRFAAASFQSLGAFSSATCDKLSFPWDLIKLYYAAFYAGHSIIRLAGQSCSYLDESHTKRLNEYLSATVSGPVLSVTAGLYHGRLIANGTQIQLSRVGGRFGGSHEDFWKIFAAFIKELSHETMTGPLAEMDAQQVFSKLDEITGLLRRRGTYGRLSTIRNELQYRHGYEGWQPSALSKSHHGEIIHLGCQWKSDPMSIRLTSGRLGNLGEFTSACAFVVGFCRSVTERVCERSAAGQKSFLRYAAMRALAT
jgi:hypothetical protein